MSITIPPEWSRILDKLINRRISQPAITITSGCTPVDRLVHQYTPGPNQPRPQVKFFIPAILAYGYSYSPLLFENRELFFNDNNFGRMQGMNLQSQYEQVLRNGLSQDPNAKLELIENIKLKPVRLKIVFNTELEMRYFKFEEFSPALNTNYISVLQTLAHIGNRTLPKGNANLDLNYSAYDSKTYEIDVYTNAILTYIWETRIVNNDIVWELQKWNNTLNQIDNILTNTKTKITSRIKSIIEDNINNQFNDVEGDLNVKPNLDCRDPEYIAIDKTDRRSMNIDCGISGPQLEYHMNCSVGPNIAGSVRTIELEQYTWKLNARIRGRNTITGFAGAGIQ